MQQRDDIPGLPFPGCWNFFGGLMEAGESPEKALERELLEELGCMPGQLFPELFQWTLGRDCLATQNHFFPISFEVTTDQLVLTEGQAMGWFPLEELVRLPLTPAVYENFSRIAKFFIGHRDDLIQSIENSLLVTYDLHKKNDRVFYVRTNPCALSRQQMFLLKELACLRNTLLFRLCLHTDDQCSIHEMLMINTRTNSVRPHKQNKSSLSYHVFEGTLTVKMHDEAGMVTREYFLGKGCAPELRYTSLRLNANEYRSIHSTSPFSIFLEVAHGPFVDNDTQWLSCNGNNQKK